VTKSIPVLRECGTSWGEDGIEVALRVGRVGAPLGEQITQRHLDSFD
jgi:hypothetical protein